MNAPGPENALRPLGLGEILDRAVNLCVKHFVPLATIFVVYAIPLAVVQFFASRDFAHVLKLFTDMATARSAAGKAADPNALAHALAAGPRLNGWYPLLVALIFFVGPLPAAALVHACAVLYLGRPTTFGAAYRAALSRWMPLIGVNFLYLGVGLILYFLVVLIAVVIFLAVVFVVGSFHALGVALAVIVSIGAGLAAVAFFILATLAIQISYFTCVFEQTSAPVSFTLAIRRVFVGVGLMRSLLVGVAYLAIGVGVAVVSLAGESILVGVLHSTVAGTTYSTIVRVATAAFTTAFIAIFYFDLRVREEGFDLQLAAERVSAQELSST